MQILLVTAMAGCSADPPLTAVNTQKGECECLGKTVCYQGRCALPCINDRECGQCESCQSGFCEKYADFCVISVDPHSGQTDVPVTLPAIKVVFSEQLAEASVPKNVQLLTESQVPVTVANMVVGKNLTIKLQEPLKDDKDYRLVIDENVKSINDFKLPENYVSTFHTAAKEGADPEDPGEDPGVDPGKADDGHRYRLEVVGGRTIGAGVTIDVLGGEVSGENRGENVQLDVGRDD